MLVMEGRGAASPGILLTGLSHTLKCDEYLPPLLFLNFPVLGTLFVSTLSRFPHTNYLYKVMDFVFIIFLIELLVAIF